MVDQEQFFFDHQEVVEELIRKQGIHKGLWMISYELGQVATNVNVLDEGKTTLTPSGMVLINRVGIRRVSEPNDLTVDAAETNPDTAPPSRKRRKRR